MACVHRFQILVVSHYKLMKTIEGKHQYKVVLGILKKAIFYFLLSFLLIRKLMFQYCSFKVFILISMSIDNH